MAVVEESFRARQSVRAVAEKYDLNANLLSAWRSKFRRLGRLALTEFGSSNQSLRLSRAERNELAVTKFRNDNPDLLEVSKVERFKAIQALSSHYSLAFLCRALSVSYSGYKYWRDKPSVPNNSWEIFLKELVHNIHVSNYSAYGAKRIKRHLESYFINFSLYKTRKLMKLAGIVANRYRKDQKRKLFFASRDVSLGFKNNDFRALEPNMKWVTDISEIKLSSNKVAYLCIVVDLYERQIVGWNLSEKKGTCLVLGTLKRALINRKHPVKLILHSDQGSEFTSGDYLLYLSKFGITPSYSRVGTPGDNAVCEAMFSLIKQDCLYGIEMPDLDVAYEVLRDYFMRSNFSRNIPIQSEVLAFHQSFYAKDCFLSTINNCNYLV
ncbi:IS3 family transposase [Marinobacterium sp. xm-d-543]|uniref:IS3 family transposase n=1 Tax=Marinobacterium sp. xm-d-543 TaxID=2497740 RepID=UPI001569C3D1|nr:IS3 family transposase [Marinobacterium sp. xm-d-543]